MAKPKPEPRYAPNYPAILIPTQAILNKYGLSESEWLTMLDQQGGVCCICKKATSTGRFVIDHLHVKGYKKLPIDIRKKYVRGILCHFCNHYHLARSVTVQKAKNLVEYLEKFETKLKEIESKSIPSTVLPEGNT